ncbi:hypothetical protein D9756_001649 [Leucocoprinus leucothites]|uniref:Uncharacterized protein n=1 Tax=Leucocoprinus leucothites TaxID=201217 RepID=A0A8H5G4E3_9AGAR|nr:hypothetical protein D9756_001649 [Leucoagaricus leucothites]
MSASPKDQQDEVAEGQQSIDELDEPQPEAEKEGGKQHFSPRENAPRVDLSRCPFSLHVNLTECPLDVPGTAETTENPPAKRGRGRPKGSKNKKSAANASSATTTTPAVPRKRGRPPKPKAEQDGEPAPKRPRGRPPKNPKPSVTEGGEGTSASGEAAAEPSTKRKPGRPKKTAS